MCVVSCLGLVVQNFVFLIVLDSLSSILIGLKLICLGRIKFRVRVCLTRIVLLGTFSFLMQVERVLLVQLCPAPRMFQCLLVLLGVLLQSLRLRLVASPLRKVPLVQRVVVIRGLIPAKFLCLGERRKENIAVDSLFRRIKRLFCLRAVCYSFNRTNQTP